MESDKNFVCAAFKKVVMRPCQIEGDSQILIDAESLNFVEFNPVKLYDAPKFMSDLKRINEKLDDAVARFYRHGGET